MEEKDLNRSPSLTLMLPSEPPPPFAVDSFHDITEEGQRNLFRLEKLTLLSGKNGSGKSSFIQTLLKGAAEASQSVEFFDFSTTREMGFGRPLHAAVNNSEDAGSLIDWLRKLADDSKALEIVQSVTARLLESRITLRLNRTFWERLRTDSPRLYRILEFGRDSVIPSLVAIWLVSPFMLLIYVIRSQFPTAFDGPLALVWLLVGFLLIGGAATLLVRSKRAKSFGQKLIAGFWWSSRARLMTVKRAQNPEISFLSESTGTQSAILLSIFLEKLRLASLNSETSVVGIIREPEAFLHPDGQAYIAEFLLSEYLPAVGVDVYLVVETHSDAFIKRCVRINAQRQRTEKEGTKSSIAARIVFFSRLAEACYARAVDFDPHGMIANYPSGFLDASLEDVEIMYELRR